MSCLRSVLVYLLSRRWTCRECTPPRIPLLCSRAVTVSVTSVRERATRIHPTFSPSSSGSPATATYTAPTVMELEVAELLITRRGVTRTVVRRTTCCWKGVSTQLCPRVVHSRAINVPTTTRSSVVSPITVATNNTELTTSDTRGHLRRGRSSLTEKWVLTIPALDTQRPQPVFNRVTRRNPAVLASSSPGSNRGRQVVLSRARRYVAGRKRYIRGLQSSSPLVPQGPRNSVVLSALHSTAQWPRVLSMALMAPLPPAAQTVRDQFYDDSARRVKLELCPSVVSDSGR